MSSRKIALIGHSASGKSSCLLQLGVERNTAEMEAVFGNKHTPSLDRALDWLVTEHKDMSVVVMYPHEELLQDLCRAKLTGRNEGQFSRIHFVYLFKPKTRLERHLAKPTASGRKRDSASQKEKLESYFRLHTLFYSLADQVIDCSNLNVEMVAVKVQAVRRIQRSSRSLSLSKV